MDWADPQEEPDKETMAKVKVLYCRNLTLTVTEESLRELFERSVVIEFVCTSLELTCTKLSSGMGRWTG